MTDTDVDSKGQLKEDNACWNKERDVTVHAKHVGLTLVAENQTKGRHYAKAPLIGNDTKVRVLLGACFNTFVCLGIPISIAVLYIDFMDVFDSSRKDAALVQAFLLACTLGLGIITGSAIQRFGARPCMLFGGLISSLGLFSSWFANSLIHLIITVGVVTGLGNSFLFISSHVVVVETFASRRVLALSMLMFATGIGQLTFPLLFSTLSRMYGVRGCLLILGGLSLNTLVSSLLITFPSENASTKNYENTNVKWKWKRLMNRVFVTYLVVVFFSVGAINSVVIVFMDFVRERGIYGKSGVHTLMIFNSANAASRLAAGMLNLIPCVHSVFLLSAAFGITGVSLTFLAYSSDYVTIVCLLCSTGVGLGLVLGVIHSVTVELLGPEVMAISTGLLTMSIGTATPIIMTFMGWVYDINGSYKLQYLITGCVTWSSSLVMITSFALDYCKRRSINIVHVAYNV